MDISPSALCDIERNAIVKWYPDGSTEITCSKHLIFRERGWEEKRRKLRGSGSSDESDNVKRAVRRARSRLRDYARANGFNYFVTLTLSPDLVADRYDICSVIRSMRTWLDNRVRRNGLKYILVPEHHKDGAIHFHGFINDALPLLDSGTLSNGGKPRKPRSKKQRAALLSDGWHVVYNVPDWRFGFSTAIALYGDYEHAVSYCCKYIGKELGEKKLPEKIGGRWYYSGGALALPEITAHNFDFAKFLADYPGNAWSMSGAGDPDIVRIFEKGGEGHDLDRWLL